MGLSLNSDTTQRLTSIVGYTQVDVSRETRQSCTQMLIQEQHIPSRKFSLRLDLITDLGKRSPSFQRKHLYKRPKEIKKTQQMLKKKQRSTQKKPNKKRSLERRRNLSKKKH